MNKVRIQDRALTIKIVNQKKNYDFTYNRLLSGEWDTGTMRKNGYLAYDVNGEELGIVFANDVPDDACYKCAEILFFKKYKKTHRVGIWRVIVPTAVFGIDIPYRIMRGKYIQYNLLEKELAEKGNLIVTTIETWHKE